MIEKEIGDLKLRFSDECLDEAEEYKEFLNLVFGFLEHLDKMSNSQ